jgi:hypothetical protein
MVHFDRGRAKDVRIFNACALAWFLVFGVAATAETDVLMRAVGFALTGTDDAEPKVIGNRGDCVFTITRATTTSVTTDVFHLNSVQTDRINIQGWESKNPVYGIERWVTIELHGDDVVFEETSESKDDGSDFMRALHEANPNLFKPSHKSYKEHELRLTTNDSGRVKRAWEYIYSHGCVGTHSPF